MAKNTKVIRERPKEEVATEMSLINPTKDDIKSFKQIVARHPWKDYRDKFDEEVIAKLQHAFAIGATNDEAAGYAGIHRATLYRHLEKDELFAEWVEELKRRPILKAKNTVVKFLGDPAVAFKYLERKASLEFGSDSKKKENENIDAETLVIYAPEKLPKKGKTTKEEKKTDDVES